MQKKEITGDFYLGIGILLFSVMVHQMALEFSSMEDVMGVGAEVFPRVFARAMIILAVLLTISGMRGDPNRKRPSFVGIHWAGLMAALCFVFVALLPTFGYLLLSPVYAVCATVIATKEFRVKDMIPVLGIVFGIYFIFAYLLNVPVPHGLLA